MEAKIFIEKGTGRRFVQCVNERFIPLENLRDDDLPELPANAVTGFVFRSLNYTQHENSIDEVINRKWSLKDCLYVPLSDGNEILFRVEHITKDKVYFVATEIIGESPMGKNNSDASIMNDFLDKLMDKMPYSLVSNMQEIEHGFGFGKKKERRKLSLLSLANVYENAYSHTGSDDMLFDGMKTEADRCRNQNGETEPYWLRSPNTGSSSNFWYVNSAGNVNYYYYAYYAYGVVPCFSISNKNS